MPPRVRENPHARSQCESHTIHLARPLPQGLARSSSARGPARQRACEEGLERARLGLGRECNPFCHYKEESETLVISKGSERILQGALARSRAPRRRQSSTLPRASVSATSSPSLSTTRAAPHHSAARPHSPVLRPARGTGNERTVRRQSRIRRGPVLHSSDCKMAGACTWHWQRAPHAKSTEVPSAVVPAGGYRVHSPRPDVTAFKNTCLLAHSVDFASTACTKFLEACHSVISPRHAVVSAKILTFGNVARNEHKRLGGHVALAVSCK